MSRKKTSKMKPENDLGRFSIPNRRFFLLVAFASFLCFLGLVGVFLVAPWQQSVPGKGKVIILNPSHRPQAIQSQISGQIAEWHVREGEVVTKGQLLADLVEVDSKYLDTNILLSLIHI